MTGSTKHRREGCPPGDSLRLLEQHLGVESDHLARLRAESGLFAEICADYEECCGKLQSLEQKGTAASRQIHDYQELRDELERELLRYLEDSVPHREPGKRVEQNNTKHCSRQIISDIP